MQRATTVLLWCIAWVVLGSPVVAGLPFCKTCPQCDNKVCVPVPETVKEKKHCWTVECKDICIPHVKWPWQSCCDPPKCGKVRTVKVLKKIEYECESCGYKWDIKTVGCSCQGAGCASCAK